VRVRVHLEDDAGNSYELLTDAAVFDPEYEQADDLVERVAGGRDMTEAQSAASPKRGVGLPPALLNPLPANAGGRSDLRVQGPAAPIS
jgi:hypothetical protein